MMSLYAKERKIPETSLARVASPGSMVYYHAHTAECKVKLTVNKADSAVTKAPEAKTLTYTGSAQELVTAGEADGGEMQYALGTETEATQPYTTSIPAATNAGTYYVWYKVVGDKNHNNRSTTWHHGTEPVLPVQNPDKPRLSVHDPDKSCIACT